MRWSLGGAEEGTITVDLCYSVRQTCCFLRLNILLMEQYFFQISIKTHRESSKKYYHAPPSPPRLHHVEIMADFSVSTCCFGHHNKIWSIYEVIVLSGCYCEAKNFFFFAPTKNPDSRNFTKSHNDGAEKLPFYSLLFLPSLSWSVSYPTPSFSPPSLICAATLQLWQRGLFNLLSS